MSPDTHNQLVKELRAYAAANPSPFRDRPLLSDLITIEDTVPDPVDLPMEWDGELRAQEEPCAVCGMPIAREASQWWHTRSGIPPLHPHQAKPIPSMGVAS